MMSKNVIIISTSLRKNSNFMFLLYATISVRPF